MRAPPLAPLLVLALAPACSDPYEPPTSADFTPAQISLLAELRTNGSTAQILVSVRGDHYNVALAEPDSLLFGEPSGPERPLVAVDGGNYVGQLETSGAEIELVFARGGERFVSKLVVPPPFSLAGPSEPASRGAPIPITWDASGGTFETWIEVTSPCLTWNITRHLSQDTGAFDIQPADLSIEPGTVACDFRVWVTRSASSGTIAQGLAPSPAPGGRQVRSISVSTLP